MNPMPKNLNDWLDESLAAIGKRLPALVEDEPKSFDCGYEMGYKQALLKLESLIEDGLKPRESQCWCKDKYHDSGGICL